MDNTEKDTTLLPKLKVSEQSEAFISKYLAPEDRFTTIVKVEGEDNKVTRYVFDELPEGEDTYYNPNRVNKRFTGNKAKKKHMSGFRAWYVDIDPHPDYTAKPDKKTFRKYGLMALYNNTNKKLLRQQAYILQEVIEPIMRGERGLIPTVLIFSGRGFQMIWFSDKTYGIRDETRDRKIKQWEGLNRAIIHMVGGDAVHNVDRLMRLPGKENTKTGLLSRVLQDSEITYKPAQVLDAYGEPPAQLDSGRNGVDPSEFRDVDWGVVFNTAEEFDLDDALLERLTQDRKRDKELDSLLDGDALEDMRDTSGSAFDIRIIGKLKRLGYEPQDAFQCTMICQAGSGLKYAGNNDRRYFMRCWSNSPGETPTAADDDFADVDYGNSDLMFTQRDRGKAHNEITSNYLYVATQETVVHRKTGTEFKVRGFDDKYSVTHAGRANRDHRGQLPKAHELLIEKGKQVDMLTWMPGQEQSYEEDGISFYNMFVPHEIEITVKWTPGCTDVYHRAMEWTIPIKAVRELLLDHFAYTLQYPHKKINWHPLLFSLMEGVGKDTILEAIVGAIGHHNCIQVDLADIMGQFNGVLKYKKVLILNEMVAFDKGQQVRNKMKPILAAPPHTFTINEKYMRPFEQPNLLSIYMTSNSSQPLSLDARDRRTWPIHCREERMPREIGEPVWEWFRSGPGHQLMYQELMARDVSKFQWEERPNGEDIMADHEIMSISSMSGPTSTLMKAIDAHDDIFRRDVVDARDIDAWAQMNRLNASAIRHSLEELGHFFLSRLSIRTGEKSARYSFWVIRNHEKYVGVKHGKLELIGSKPVFAYGITPKVLYDVAHGDVAPEFKPMTEDDIL